LGKVDLGADLGMNMAQHYAFGQKLLMVAVLAVLMACTPTLSRHGYVPEAKDLDRIILGQDTRESVALLIGRPSTSGLLNDVGWFYVQSAWKQRGAAAPVEVDRQVVAISFDDKGTVSNIERFGMEKGQVVALSRRVTKDNVASAGFLRQLFGNIGGITPSALVPN
jgi:outer membrane protein assembly factor BamE (lipoprotein component of BamABCDE complex)